MPSLVTGIGIGTTPITIMLRVFSAIPCRAAVRASTEIARCLCSTAQPPATSAPAPAALPTVPEDPTAWIQPARLSKAELRQARETLPTLRPKLYQAPPMSYKERMLYPLRKAIGAYSKWAVISENVAAVMRSCEEQATQEAWYTALGLPRSFMTEHSLLALHLWMIHRRHVVDFWEPGEFCGRLSDKEMFEAFWQDTQRRIRAVGVTEMSVNKQLEHVQKATLMDMFELDTGLAATDDENLSLAGALYRGLFQQDPDIPAERVLLMADWVRREVWNILTQPVEDVYRGWITWSPVLGESREQRLDRQKQLFDGSQWRDAVWIDGSVYFANPVTGERTRKLEEVPAGALTGRRRWALIQHMAQLHHAGQLPAAYENDPALRLMEEAQAKQAQLAAIAEAAELEEQEEQEEQAAAGSRGDKAHLELESGPHTMDRASAEQHTAGEVWSKQAPADSPAGAAAGAYPPPKSGKPQ